MQKGFTVDKYGRSIDSGWAVSIRPQEIIVPDRYRLLPVHIGGWENKDGDFILDFVVAVENREFAETLGKINNQTHIFNLDIKEEFKL